MIFRSIFKATLLITVLFSAETSWSQNTDGYRLVNSNGKKVSWNKMTKKMNAAEAVFFGEEHNCIMAHWLTLRLMKEWTKSDSLNKTFASEMFERDQQAVLDSVINGQINLEKIEDHTRSWSNYESDYAQYLEFSLQKKMNIVASNIPRKYASILFKKGVDSLKALPANEKEFICPLDFTVDKELSQYAALTEMAVRMGDRGTYFIEAQAIKDATMGESIAKELKAGRKVFHLNGSYHSDFQQGILWYLNSYRPNTKTVTFSIIRQDGKKLPKDMKGKADFIFIIPSDFPVSY